MDGVGKPDRLLSERTSNRTDNHSNQGDGSEGRMTPKKEEELYKALSSQYKLVVERTDALSGRAQALLSFGGIADAILVAIIMQVTNETARAFLTQHIYLPLLETVVFCGFTSYVLSIVFSLLAFKTQKPKLVPQLVQKSDSKPGAAVEFVKAVLKGDAELSVNKLSLQVAGAIEYHLGLNERKYRWLLLGTLFMFVATVFTAILGIILFLSIG
jgi:hypothetical protein